MRLGEFHAREPTAQPDTTGAAMTGSKALDNHRQAPQARRACAGSRLWITTAKLPTRAAGTGSKALDTTAQPETTGAAMTGSRLWITTAKPPKHAEPAQDPGSGYQLPSSPRVRLGRDPSSGYDRPARDGIQALDRDRLPDRTLDQCVGPVDPSN